MKKWGIVILAYIILALILSAVTSIPPKIDERARESHLESLRQSSREYLKKYNIPEDIKEEAIAGAAEDIQGLYESQNTFAYRFTQKLMIAGIGLLILPIIILSVEYDKKKREWWRAYWRRY